MNWTLGCWLWLAAPALAAAQDAVARIDGVDVTRTEFQDWLVAAHGWRFLDDYLALVLLRKEATRLGIAVPDRAQLEAAFEADWNDQVTLRFRGNESMFLRELKEGGLDRDGYRQRRIGSFESEILGRQLVVATRQPTEPELREFHAREFAGDQRLHLRIAFFDKLKKVKPGQQVTRQFAEQEDAEARKRAGQFLATLTQDPANQPIWKTDSDPLYLDRRDNYLYDLRELGGDLPRYRKDHLGGILEGSLKEAQAGQWLGPIAAANGYYVVRVVERVAAPFDATRGEVETLVKHLLPSAGEIHALRLQLLEKARIERLPIR